MKSVMLFAPDTEARNFTALRHALADIGNYGISDFVPFRSIFVSVELALAKMPDVLLITLAPAGIELKVALSTAGFVGTTALRQTFADAVGVVRAIQHGVAMNRLVDRNDGWAWTEPRRAAQLREDTVTYLSRDSELGWWQRKGSLGW